MMMPVVWLLAVIAIVAVAAYVRAGLAVTTALLGALLAAYWLTADAGLAWKSLLAVLWLPLAHSFARMIAYYGLYAGSITAFARSIDGIADIWVLDLGD